MPFVEDLFCCCVFWVTSIIVIIGECHKHEVWQIERNHIQDLGAEILVTVPDTNTKMQTKFETDFLLIIIVQRLKPQILTKLRYTVNI